MNKTGRGPKLHTPSANQQEQRLQPQFKTLSQIVTQQSGELRASPTGLAPEQVLVFEIIGTVEDFTNAVRRVSGMEWLTEWVNEDAHPDEFFFDLTHEGKTLARRLFFVTANQRAMDELLSLWSFWLHHPTAKLAHGLGKWKHVFRQLRSIRRWSVRDRLLETGAIEDWRYQIEHGSGEVHVEIEFWFRDDEQTRSVIEGEYESAVAAANGHILARSVLPQIGYHAVLAQMPPSAVNAFIGGSDEIPLQSSGTSTDWLYFDQIMQVRATGQISIAVSPEYASYAAAANGAIDAGAPIGALLDGMPLTLHDKLRDRLLVDDPLDWGDNYPAARRLHGTAMASIIANGDLNDTSAGPLHSLLYVRPVMVPREDSQLGEHIPRNVLSTDLLYTAVRRMFVGEGSEAPYAPTVRVINLSICHADRPFFESVSPLARLLDWLAFEYDVLFVVSAGNHSQPIILDSARGATESMDQADLQNATLRAVLLDARNRRLLSPAESINSLTAGASHTDSAGDSALNGVLNPIANSECCSPIGSLGFGFRRSVKPDILAAGGRQLYRAKPGTTHAHEVLLPTQSSRPLGVSVATPGREGETAARTELCGTSNAAARVTREAIQIIETLDGLAGEAGMPLVADPFRALAAKCLVTHGASWGQAFQHVTTAALGIEGDPREIAGRLLGYGCTLGSEIAICTDERVTVLGLGHLADGEAHLYDLPIPSDMSGLVLWRRLSVTLAWNSPIRIRHQKYRGAALWFVVPDFKDLGLSRAEADWQAVQRGTVQHEIFEGTAAFVVNDDDHVRLAVNCRADAGQLRERVPYVLAVTLEVMPGTGIPIYERVNARLRQPVAVRV